jgi:hypothetical protein
MGTYSEGTHVKILDPDLAPKTAQIAVLMPQAMRAAIETYAEIAGVTLSAMVRLLLEAGLQEADRQHEAMQRQSEIDRLQAAHKAQASDAS